MVGFGPNGRATTCGRERARGGHRVATGEGDEALVEFVDSVSAPQLHEPWPRWSVAVKIHAMKPKLGIIE
jgi:hypothetical protein